MAWALLRGLGLDRLGHPLVALVAFTPYVAATAPLPVLAALVLRRRVVAFVALAAGLVLAAALVPRVLGGSPDAPAGPRLTVMSSNQFLGNAEPAAVVALVRERRVDVLSLLELSREALGRLDAAGLRELLPHRVVDAGPEREGNGSAVLAARPLRRVPVPPGGMAQPAALVRVPGAPPVRVQAVHPLPPIDRAKLAAWRADLRRLPPAGGTRTLGVLAGDFNATLDHHELRRLLAAGYDDAAEALGEGLVPTWPTGRRLGRLTIDHVLADERVTPVRFTVHTLPGTDHRAVVADLALPAAGGPRARG